MRQNETHKEILKQQFGLRVTTQYAGFVAMAHGVGN